MNILLCAAEVVPFAKVGGLADVMGSLPKALAEIDLKPVVVLPRYGSIDPEHWNLTKTPWQYDVELDGQTYPIEVWQGQLPDSGNHTVPVYFIENMALFGSRKDVYPYGQQALEVQSFKLLSKAVFGLMRAMEFYPDVLHLHDWHTAPVAKELAELRQHNPKFKNIRSVFTIHNLAYQGVFDGVNWLKEGLSKADALTTVSPTYAQEIQTPEFGEGLQDLLKSRAGQLHGILNGIDMNLLNPKTDKFLPKSYGPGDFKAGKNACKEALQQEMGLPTDTDSASIPLIGFVSRLVDQKGLDIMLPALEQVAADPSFPKMQWAILGSGEPRYEEGFKALNTKYPHLRTFIGFNLALAQKIYAGSDMFAMPSAFEPCGLGQLIALRYGSVPVVRSVGGLADTVFDIRHDADKGNGFCFKDYTVEAFVQTLKAALTHYENQKQWEVLVNRGLSEDFSWRKSAKTYADLYRSLTPAASAVS